MVLVFEASKVIFKLIYIAEVLVYVIVRLTTAHMPMIVYLNFSPNCFLPRLAVGACALISTLLHVYIHFMATRFLWATPLV